MAPESHIAALIELAYAAGTDASQWPVFLKKLGQVLQAPWGVFLVQDVQSQAGSYTASFGIDPYHLRAYDEYYSKRNVWTIASPGSLVPGAITPTDAVVPVSELVKTEFYNDFLRPVYRARHGIAATILRDGTLTANVSVVRTGAAGAFGAEAVRLMELLAPHMQRAIETHRRLTGVRLEEHAVLSALDRLAFGVLLVAGDARPLFVNIEGRRILAMRDGLSLEHGMLSATRASDTQLLRASVNAAAMPGGGGAHIALGRPSLRRPLGVEVTPLNLPAEDGLPSRIVGVFVTDPDRQAESDDAVLARLYGLTPAEAALAASLVAGNTLEEIADHRGITLGTARIHLKRILRKTDTRRQAELIGRLLEGPASLTRSDVARANGAGSHEPTGSPGR